jgi:hypothetical protein
MLQAISAPLLSAVAAVAARLHALGLATLLGEVRRPRRVAQAPGLVAVGERVQRVEPPSVLVDVGGRIAERPQPLGHGVEPQLARVDVGHLVPGDRARDARIGRRAHRVGRGDRAVARVLVVVDEHAVALLLPPLARRERRAPLDLAGQGQRGAAHLGERPRGLDPDVDVHALRPARLRVAAQLMLLQHVAHDHRDLAHISPTDSRRGVEVDPQLIGMVEVISARRPRVEVDDAEVVGPGEVGGVVGAQLLGGAAGWEGDRRGLEPLGDLLRNALLPDRLLLDAIDEALHDRGPLAQVHQHGVGRVQVVVHEVVLREPRLREVELPRIGEADRVPGHLDRHVLGLCHAGGAL